MIKLQELRNEDDQMVEVSQQTITVIIIARNLRLKMTAQHEILTKIRRDGFRNSNFQIL